MRRLPPVIRRAPGRVGPNAGPFVLAVACFACLVVGTCVGVSVEREVAASTSLPLPDVVQADLDEAWESVEVALAACAVRLDSCMAVLRPFEIARGRHAALVEEFGSATLLAAARAPVPRRDMAVPDAARASRARAAAGAPLRETHDGVASAPSSSRLDAGGESP